MNKFLPVILFFFISLSFSVLDTSFAQCSWKQKFNFGGTIRYTAVGFSIGSKGYIGTGQDNDSLRSDFWQYDTTTNTWTQKANFGGTAREYAVGFSIGNKGYIGTGQDNDSIRSDFWQYNPGTNSWAQKARFAGTARQYAVGFSIGAKGYIGTGWDANNTTQDFWQYDTLANSWTKKLDVGGMTRGGAVGFSIGSKGYIGTGYDGVNNNILGDFWQYNPSTNSWIQKTGFGGTPRYLAAGFSIGSKGYIGTGYDGNYTKDFWQYDTTANIWTKNSDFGGTARYFAVGFSIGNKGYIGTGYDNNYTNDFWQYDPSVIPLPNINIPLPNSCPAFANTFVNGNTQDTGYIQNVGCGVLNISNISSSSSDFQIIAFPSTVAPFDSGQFVIRFKPTNLGSESTTITVFNNDADTSFCLQGTGIAAPTVSVTPTSFNVSLGCNSTLTSSLVINNSGAGNLNWQVSGSGNKKILLLPADYSNYETDVQSKLMSTGKFTLVDIMDVQSTTPTLSQLQAYDAVLTWTDYSYQNSTLLGNVLADYVDAGGGVVTAIFTTGNWSRIGGRFDSQNYWAINPTNYYYGGSNQTLGTIFQPLNPIMKNVTSLTGNSRPSSNAIMSGAVNIANWSDGMPLVVTKNINGHNRVDLGLWPPSNDVTGGNSWVSSTNGATLMANALQWCGKGGASWLSFAPASGTSSSGNSSTVTVTFNSTGLTVGTYTANILVASNDPLHLYDTIPATLHVTGSPKIALNKTCLNYGSLIDGATLKDSVMITNTGCDTLRASSIVATPSVFTVSPTGGNLAPGQSGYVKVTFTPVAVTSYSGTITFHSNVNDTTICLTGTGLAPLSLSVPLAGGYLHSLAICSVCDDGFSWGYNGNGQLGDSTTTDRHTPVPERITGIVSVAAGYYHSLALKSNGTVWTWGNNGNGQLGDGSYNQRIIPVNVNGLTGTNIAVAAGAFHSLALKSNGSVWAWGWGNYGQLGNGT
ncbi:MAG: choice-of-anchor D domain-containing protein, partial [Bacteroidia bacterium]